MGAPLLLLLWLYYDEFGLPTRVTNIISDGHEAIEQGKTGAEPEAAQPTATAEPKAAQPTATAEPEAAQPTATAERQAAQATATAEPEADWATARAELRAAAVAKVTELEQHIHLGINAQREAHGRPPLRHVDHLAAVARAHSNDMDSRGYFSHDTPEGTGPYERVSWTGYNCHSVYENIYYSGTSGLLNISAIASEAVTWWMNSPRHRTTILNGRFDRTGVGASFGKYPGNDRWDAWYITQLFCF